MKVAYHFLSVHPDLAGLGSGYGYQIMRKVLRKILDRPVINMHTKVFIGDLLLDQYSRERETTEDGYIERFSREKNSSLFDRWLHPQLGCLKMATEAQFCCPGFGPRSQPTVSYLGTLIGCSAYALYSCGVQNSRHF